MHVTVLSDVAQIVSFQIGSSFASTLTHDFHGTDMRSSRRNCLGLGECSCEELLETRAWERNRRARNRCKHRCLVWKDVGRQGPPAAQQRHTVSSPHNYGTGSGDVANTADMD